MSYNVSLPDNKNWRSQIGKNAKAGEYGWRIHLHKEFVDFMEELEQLVDRYDWNLWGGMVNNYAVTLSQIKVPGKAITIKMIAGEEYKYYACFKNATNPNNVKLEEYETLIGNSMDETLKYVHNFLNDNKYIKDSKEESFCFLGGAYNRYPMELYWEQQRISKKQKQN